MCNIIEKILKEELKPCTKLIAISLFILFKNKNNFSITNNKLLQYSRCSIRTINNALKELVDNQLINVEINKNIRTMNFTSKFYSLVE